MYIKKKIVCIESRSVKYAPPRPLSSSSTCHIKSSRMFILWLIKNKCLIVVAATSVVKGAATCYYYYFYLFSFYIFAFAMTEQSGNGSGSGRWVYWAGIAAALGDASMHWPWERGMCVCVCVKICCYLLMGNAIKTLIVPVEYEWNMLRNEYFMADITGSYKRAGN